MKKLATLILSVLILSLVGCNKTENASSNISFADYTAESSAVTEDTNSESKIENTETVDSTKNNFSVSEKVPTKAETNNDSKLNSNTNQNSDTNTNASSSIESKSAEPQYKTIQLRTKTTYYGYEGYFDYAYFDESDICLVELGLSDENLACAAPSEYKDVDLGIILCFVMYNDSNAVIKEKDIAYNHVYVKGEGSELVKVTNAKKYEKCNQPLNEYLIVSNGYDGSIYSYVNAVDIYTVGVSANVEGEIISVFYNNFGYQPSHSYNCYFYGRFSIDDSGKPYEIYRYSLSDTVKDKK